ncbi:MAG: precorrin-2 C(20)-methyltransferase [Pseudomonadota bacterium]
MTGTLHGVGVGPGDPELMTLRAHRLIAGAPAIAYPAPLTDAGLEPSFARGIAAAAIPPDALEIPIPVPMRPERGPAQAAYDAAAETIAGHLTAGRDVVALCEGDPLFYGSFMYLLARLSDRFPCEITPGVSSLAACAAAARRPLCARDENLRVISGAQPTDALRAELRSADAAAILKVGRRLPRIRAEIEAAGLLERAVYVSHASLDRQIVTPLASAPVDAPYFSMILIAGRDPFAERAG